MTEKSSPVNVLVGLGTYGAALVGVLGLIGAAITFLNGESVASATFLVASALAFGLLTRALLAQ